jgi:hypothetical protein
MFLLDRFIAAGARPRGRDENDDEDEETPMIARDPFWRRAALGVAVAALAACGDNDTERQHLRSLTTELVQYQTCADLETDIEAMLIDELETSIERIRDSRGWPESGDDGGATPPPSAPGGDRQEGEDFSGTNNQEDGVDEADFVKTDGYHVYVLNGRRLHVFGVPSFGQLVPESVTEIEGYPTELLLDRDAGRAVVFSSIDPTTLPADHPLRARVGRDGDYGWYWRIDNVSKITVLDVSDQAHPALVREVYFEGHYQTARKIDSSVRVAGYSYLSVPALWRYWEYYERAGQDVAVAKALARADIEAMTLADFVPQIYVRTPDGQMRDESLTTSDCQSFYRPTDSHARGVSTIMSFDLLGDTLAFDADQILTNYTTFYASTDTLVMTEAAHDWWWYWWWEDDPEHLNVHAFDISAPGQTSYIGSGRVEGWVADQFSIDEEEGTIRIATTIARWGRWWDEDPPQSDNHIWVLAPEGGRLATIGHVGGIEPGESITSARFVGDKAYLVTFERTDPLLTFDLSNPRNPRQVGVLEVPGFSTYLHPIADGRILSIGVGGDENGANWRTQISLFDVSDFARPTLQEALPIEMENGWGWSEALWEHKAFQYWAPEKVLAVPQSSYQYIGTTPEGWEDYRYLSRLELVTVDTETGLSRKGRIDHTAYYEEPSEYRWTYVDIRRSIFMGDFIYAISDKAITVHRTADLTFQTAQTLPGYVPGDYYWWW